MKKIEYKILNYNGTDNSVILEKWLNDLGKDGWDLFSFNRSTYMFKREIIEKIKKEKKNKEQQTEGTK